MVSIICPCNIHLPVVHVDARNADDDPGPEGGYQRSPIAEEVIHLCETMK